MKIIASIILAAFLCLPAMAKEKKLEDYDKAVLVQLIENQKKIIAKLEAQIQRLEKLLREAKKEAPDKAGVKDEPAAAGKTYSGPGNFLTSIPSEHVPKKGQTWATYRGGVTKWLHENSKGITIKTTRRKGQTYAVRSLSWEDGQGTVFLTQAVKTPGYTVRVGNTIHSGRSTWIRMQCTLARRALVGVSGFSFTTKDAKLYRELEAAVKDETTYTMKAKVSGVTISESGAIFVFNLDGEPELTKAGIKPVVMEKGDKVPDVR